VKYRLPQSLTIRFVLLTVCILVAMQLSFSWVMSRRQGKLVQNTMRRNAVVMATTLATSAGHHLQEGEMAPLERLFRAALHHPNVRRILVVDTAGRVLLGLERHGAGQGVFPAAISTLQPPAVSGEVITESPTDLVLWEPLPGGGRPLWLQVTYSFALVKQMQGGIWQSTLLLALVWICLGGTAVVLAMRPPLLSIARLVRFARELPERQGDQVKIRGGTVEIRHLADALNGASLELKSREVQLVEERQYLKIALDELRRTEETRREQQEFLTSILESLTHPLYVVDAVTFEVIHANSAARRGDLVPGITCHAMTHMSPVPCSDTDHPCPLQLVKQRRKPVTVEHVHYEADGTHRIYEVHGYPIFGADGQVIQMLEYSIDVTEQRLARQVMHRSELRSAALFRLSQSPAESREELLDRALEESLVLSGSRVGFLFRYDEERRELVLNSWSRGVMPACSVAAQNEVYRLDDAGIWAEAVRIRSFFIANDLQQPHPSRKGLPEGHLPLKRFLGVPVFDGERIVALLGVANRNEDYDEGDAEHLAAFMDSVWKVAERLRADAALRQLNEELEERVRQRTSQLEEANEELESFCYSVSHDLRAPLRHIDGYGRMLLDDYAERVGEAGSFYLKRMREATVKMGLLIDDLLQLSRVSRAEFESERVDLSAMVADICGELQEEEPERRAEFRIEEGIIVMGDARLLRVAMDNLLANAWKFTAKRQEALISFGRAVKDDLPCLVLQDNGAGFDMTYADKLFGPFQRLHRPDEFEGTGVGLATVQRVIHRHGGTIWAESVLDEGATFYLTLPLVS
jgi:signal transduction histidine kinase